MDLGALRDYGTSHLGRLRAPIEGDPSGCRERSGSRGHRRIALDGGVSSSTIVGAMSTESRPLQNGPWPASVNEAVGQLLGILSADDKSLIAAKSRSDLVKLHRGLGLWIRNNFGLSAGNMALIHDAGARDADDAAGIIIEALWTSLQRGRTNTRASIRAIERHSPVVAIDLAHLCDAVRLLQNVNTDACCPIEIWSDQKGLNFAWGNAVARLPASDWLSGRFEAEPTIFFERLRFPAKTSLRQISVWFSGSDDIVFDRYRVPGFRLAE